MEDLFTAVNLRNAYDLTYRLASRAVHATDFMDHLDFTADGIALKMVPGGGEWALTVRRSSNSCFFEILKLVNVELKLGHEEAIEVLRKEIRARPDPDGISEGPAGRIRPAPHTRTAGGTATELRLAAIVSR